MATKRGRRTDTEKRKGEAEKAQRRRLISRVRKIDLQGDVQAQLLDLMKLLSYVCKSDHEAGEKNLVIYVRVED